MARSRRNLETAKQSNKQEESYSVLSARRDYGVLKVLGNVIDAIRASFPQDSSCARIRSRVKAERNTQPTFPVCYRLPASWKGMEVEVEQESISSTAHVRRKLPARQEYIASSELTSRGGGMAEQRQDSA